MSLAGLLAVVLKALVICFVFAMSLGSLLTWAERKLSAAIQDRVGPNRASVAGIRALGLFHPIADMLKTFTKEDFVPQGASKVLFFVAPIIAFVPPLLAFSVIPFGPSDHLVTARLDSGVVFVLAIMALGIYGAILGGWASNNSFALLGSLRAAAQTVSYEVSMGMNLVGVFVVFETLSLTDLVFKQGDLLFGVVPKWGIVVQPLAFILFLTAAMAENKRAPFDLPEGESEILGYNVEYSSMRFALFFLSEFVEVVLIATVASVVFLGGWQIPYYDPMGTAGGAAILLHVLAFLVKIVVMCWLLLVIRWTLPRFRYDQVMNLGWRWLLPLSMFNVVATALVVAVSGG